MAHMNITYHIMEFSKTNRDPSCCNGQGPGSIAEYSFFPRSGISPKDRQTGSLFHFGQILDPESRP